MSSSISHQIKHRQNPKDVFITPECLAITQIVKTEEIFQKKFYPNTPEYKNIVPVVWYDPFKNTGNYFNNFPNKEKGGHLWAEILEGKDFFKYNPEEDVGHTDNLIICSNPPFSMMDKIYERCIELKPKVISLMVALHSLTPKRLEMMNEAGYVLEHMHMCKVFSWYGMSCYVIFVLDTEVSFKGYSENLGGKLSFDRNVWR